MENCTKELNKYCLPLRKRYGTSRLLNLDRKYRSDFEIIALILESLKGGGAGRYLLMKHTGVNYAQLEKYLKTLAVVGFIETSSLEGQTSYKASEKGLAFLGQYYVLLGMLLNAYSTTETAKHVYEAECATPILQKKSTVHS